MQFKEGYLWKVCYDEERDLYTAFIGATSFSLYEISKEIFDELEDGMGQEAQIPIGRGRKLYMAVNDRFGPPYTVVLDEDYAKLVPWANVEPVGDILPTEMVDAVVEVLESEEDNREQRRKKREEREKTLQENVIMKSKYVTLKDKTKLFCTYSIGDHNKTIIIIHGGPGNGFWDQTLFMEKLSDKYNVIAFDERGVNKSDEIKEDFTSELLVDDIDEVRSLFNVDKAIFIGHSYGGHLLLRYCLKYQKHIERAIFMCPSFNLIDSLHTVIELSKKELTERNMDTGSLLNALTSSDLTEIMQGLAEIPEDVRNDVYGYSYIDEDIMTYVSRYMPSETEIIKSCKHQEAIFSEDELCKDKTELLKDINCNNLLIVGDHDPVCTKEQIDKYKKYVKNGNIAVVKNSYHFPYLDQIEETIRIIDSYEGE